MCWVGLLLYRQPIRLFILCLGFIFAKDLHVFGTFDFNRNGKSEIFKLNGLNAPLELVELNEDGSHLSLWQYTPKNDELIVDVKFADLNSDGVQELILAQKGNKNNNWLSIFEWNGQSFVKNKEPFKNEDASADLIRPSNLASFANIFSASISTPSRSSTVFSLELNEGAPVKSSSQLKTSPLISNGYGPVYVGMFKVGEDGYAALISPEGNILKVSVFSLSNINQEISSELLSLNGARVILGPDIQPFDENNDGNQELLIPFATDEIYALALTDSGITFTESKLSQFGLFGMKSAAGEDEINKAVLSRIEMGLYEPPLGVDPSTISDSLIILVSDTLMLGDSLNMFILPDSIGDLYSFKWSAPPPSGMKLNPDNFKVEWVPKREHIGVVDLSYFLEVRLKEELISGENEFGDTHQIYPVLQNKDSSFVVLVGDTIKPPKPFVLIPPRFHRVEISTKDIKETDRFTFDGETPFSATTVNSNGIITVGVGANLSWIKQDKAGTFNFISSSKKPDSLVTLSIIHDLSNNIFYASLLPTLDSLSQSFDLEGWDLKRYKFPEYFFEGFPLSLALDSINGSGVVSLLSSNKATSGLVSISSPLFDQQHGMTISYFGGKPHAIRGDITVKENGSHKTLTEIDFESSFSPTNINVWLNPESRDTLVFHADSIPDTLKSRANFRSFYSLAKVINKIPPKALPDSSALESPTLVDSLVSQPLDTLNLEPDVLQELPDSSALESPTLVDSLVSQPLDTLNLEPEGITNESLLVLPDSTR